ncbi:MAG: S9 family peptidase [Verrucomicrobia bacterium]|nr:S9 family peptidase [Verrucomicrobiota bacterium]
MRTRCLQYLYLCLVTCQTFAVSSRAASQSPVPPIAPTRPHRTEIHGLTLEDPYFWLREKTNPAVIRYLKAENRHAQAMMKPTEALQKTLFKEMRSHIKETDLSVPVRDNGYYYYSRQVRGKQYAVHCRKKGGLEAPEEVLLDVNQLARGQKFMAVGEMSVSDDGRWLAYTTDTTGFRDYTLQVKDLQTGKLLPMRVAHVDGVEWAADNRTLFYAVEDDAKRSYRLYRVSPQAGAPATLVYEEKDERFTVGIHRSRSKAYLFLELDSHTTTEVRFLKADRPEGAWTLMAAREADHEYYVDHNSDWFYIRSNKPDRNFALFRTPVAQPERPAWKVVIPPRPDVLLANVDLFKDCYVLSEVENARTQLRITDLRTGDSHRIPAGEETAILSLHANPEFDSQALRYGYESFITPRSVYDYHWKERRNELLKATEVPGGFDPKNYATERIVAKAPDGKSVPISLVRRVGSGQGAGQPGPLLLQGYGAYGIPSWCYFSSSRLALLDRGVTVAIAHIRGGTELGQPWHDDGRMLKKKNTFSDFIACADHLVQQGYTSRDKMAIAGGSAGGLLIGAVLNARPDLCGAATLDVPFVDVVNTMLDETLPLTVGEFEEWGNPKKRPDFDYIRTYCPYTNLRQAAYPPILINTSLNDSQVMYWEPAKYTAKLRSLKQDHNPLLLNINMDAGHGGASGRYDRLKEIAFDYAFILTQLRVKSQGP